MRDQAEELHQESLKLLAKLASNSPPFVDVHVGTSPTKSGKSRKNSCGSCFGSKCNGECDKENRPQRIIKNNDTNKTPKKEYSSNEPLTPTANLKMLVCAASVLTPANSMNDEKRQLFTNDNILSNTEHGDILLEQYSESIPAKKGQLIGRKEKSLGLLCKRFMLIYPEYSPNGTTIFLDDVVKSLGIGRRRVYDIVNVLESMEMMVRQAKNKYLWFGKSRLPATLTKLKALAFRVYGKCTINNNNNQKQKYQTILPKTNSEEHERNPSSVLTDPESSGLHENPNIKEEENNNNNNNNQKQKYQTILPKTNSEGHERNPLSVLTDPESNGLHENPNIKEENKDSAEVDDFTSSIMDYIISCDTRKENSRSLGILCQKFIMLFMVAEDSIVTLDSAARVLINEQEEGPSKYKTKVRRLYDIANILTSIKFLEKTTCYENAAKKAAYKWVGIDLNSLDSEEDIKHAFQSLEFSVTRHSLLANVPRTPSDLNANRKLQCRSASAHQLTSPGSILENSGKLKFPRTFSAAAATETLKQNDDGFDIEQFKENAKEGARAESPNQVLFKEKLRDLQKEFPDKLSNNGLIELLSSKTTSSNLRRSLSSDFDDNNFSFPAKKMKLDILSSTEGTQAVKPEESSVSLVALKPLLSYVGEKNTDTPTSLKETNKASVRPPNTTSSKYVPIRVAQQETMTNKLKTSVVNNRLCQPILVSTVGAPMSLQKGGGLYQIIPLQCKPINKTEKPIPVFIGQAQQQQRIQNVSSNSPSSNVMTMLMRPPIVTMTSPSVLLSPRNPTALLKSTAAEATEGYFTPPHVIPNGCGIKPPANPILFPKMTPETPSSDPTTGLNAVTRKLLALQNGVNE